VKAPVALFLGGGVSILCYSQSGNDPHEDLAKFGYELSMKVTYKKKSSIFLATLLESCIEI